MKILEFINIAINHSGQIKKKFATALLIIFFIAGGYLRFVNLDRNSFWKDEFRHVYVAKGILETGKQYYHPAFSIVTQSVMRTW